VWRCWHRTYSLRLQQHTNLMNALHVCISMCIFFKFMYIHIHTYKDVCVCRRTPDLVMSDAGGEVKLLLSTNMCVCVCVCIGTPDRVMSDAGGRSRCSSLINSASALQPAPSAPPHCSCHSLRRASPSEQPCSSRIFWRRSLMDA
jgi:hypothetical protein